MLPHGVKLEQNKRAILRRGILEAPVPEDFPVTPSFAPARQEPAPKGILAAAEEAGICDETDGELLRDKLEKLAKRKTKLLAALCFDDDPAAAGEEAFLQENAEKIADGLALAAKACRAGETVIAAASRKEARWAAEKCSGVRTVSAGKRYPAAYFLLRKLRGSGKTAAFLGAQACAALSDAVREGLPQRETVVTVTGGGAAKPGNYRVRIGVPLSSVLKAAGAAGPRQFVAVGPAMTGRNVRGSKMPVTASTRCVTVTEKAPKIRVFPCVRCGRCAETCPVGVVPWLIHREMEGKNPEPLLLFHVGDCVGCRACDVVCPSGIGLAEEVKRAAALKEGGTPRDAL